MPPPAPAPAKFAWASRRIECGRPSNACIRNKAIANIRQHRGNPDTPMQLRVFVNGEATVTSAATLAELVAQFGFAELSVATALNGDFVPRGARQGTRLAGDDKVEIVSPRQGG